MTRIYRRGVPVVFQMIHTIGHFSSFHVLPGHSYLYTPVSLYLHNLRFIPLSGTCSMRDVYYCGTDSVLRLPFVRWNMATHLVIGGRLLSSRSSTKYSQVSLVLYESRPAEAESGLGYLGPNHGRVMSFPDLSGSADIRHRHRYTWLTASVYYIKTFPLFTTNESTTFSVLPPTALTLDDRSS
jgi:hypothetical protein